MQTKHVMILPKTNEHKGVKLTNSLHAPSSGENKKDPSTDERNKNKKF